MLIASRLAERRVELHLADDVAERRARERLERVREVLHGVRRLLRIGDAVVEDGVDVDRDVVLRDHRLAGKVQHLLAQVDARGRARGDLLRATDGDLEIADVDRLRALDQRDQNVEPGARDAMKAPEPLDHHDLGLPDDLERREAEACGEREQDEDEGDRHGSSTGYG